MRTHYIFGRTQEGELSREAVGRLLAEARERHAAIRALPVASILLLLEKLGRAWADPDFAPRRRVLEETPAMIGFSREMVELELYGLTMALSRPYLEGKLQTELGRPDAMDAWHRRSGSEVFQRAVPRGTVLHVASGNVSTTGVLSLIEGLLTRNVNFLKVASNAPLLPLLFAESLRAIDEEGVIASSFAILSWSGEKTPHHEVFQQEADAIVIWGGEEVIHTYRRGLALKTRLVEYGPKVSCGLYGSEAIAPEQVATTAAKAARDLSIWDQSACSSPQVLYLEDASPDRSGLARFLAALAPALDAVAEAFPMGQLTMQEKAEITKERQMAAMDEVMGLGRLITPAGQTWTVIVEHDPTFKLSPLYRTIYLKPVAALEEALPQLAPYRDYLQTVALAVGQERAGAFADAAVAAGAHRVVRVGEMSGGFPGEPHDGVYGLAELVRWASLDTPEAAEAYDGERLLTSEQRRRVAWAKRRRLVESTAPQSAFYRSHWGERTLSSEADWLALPLLEKAQVVANTPPAGEALLTQAPAGAHWLRSGGSSGDPKLSIFSYADYEDDMWRAARGAHAAGLRRGEKVANLFFAGDLYGSFLSLNRTLELLGCNSFPFTNHASSESVITCLREFGIGTVIGQSTWVQAVLAEAMKRPEGLRIRHVLYAGEHFHEKERLALMQGLGVEKITSIGYGAVDAGPMGYQCPHCPGAVHHLHEDHVYLELLDLDSGTPVAEGAIGEVVVSNLNRRIMPLVRYRLGDLGRWVEGPCACGDGSRRFELLGRVEDRIRLGTGEVYFGEIQRVIAGLPPLASNPQVVLGEEERLAVRAELIAPGLEAGPLAEQLKAGLVASLPALAAAGDRLTVEVVPPGGLERLGRSGKVLRIVDRRTPSA